MFTGLIQKKGVIKRISRGKGLVVEIGFEPWQRLLEKGESVAVNGVCLTVADCDERRFTADVLRETESRTTLGELFPGEKVNLERALRAGDRFGGHIVQGHVDGIGTISEKISRGRDFRLRIKCSRVIAANCILKGSIAVDGVSLTITEAGSDYIAVDVIPTTAAETTLGMYTSGRNVNLETDVIGKYASKSSVKKESGLTEAKLAEAGFI
jgi:riboflavin synthase